MPISSYDVWINKTTGFKSKYASVGLGLAWKVFAQWFVQTDSL